MIHFGLYNIRIDKIVMLTCRKKVWPFKSYVDITLYLLTFSYLTIITKLFHPILLAYFAAYGSESSGTSTFVQFILNSFSALRHS